MTAISPPSLAQLDYEETPPSEYVVRSVIPEDRARAVVTKPRTKIKLARVHQPIARLVLEDDDTDYYDELPDLQIGYRRPELVNQTAKVHDDISDEIKLRLLLARKRALEVHRQNWG
jgi:hypothetical protein